MLQSTTSKGINDTLNPTKTVYEMSKLTGITFRIPRHSDITFKNGTAQDNRHHHQHHEQHRQTTSTMAAISKVSKDTASSKHVSYPNHGPSSLAVSIPPESAYILDQKLEAHPRLATPEELRFCASLTGLSEAAVDAYLRSRLGSRPTPPPPLPPLPSLPPSLPSPPPKVVETKRNTTTTATTTSTTTSTTTASSTTSNISIDAISKINDIANIEQASTRPNRRPQRAAAKVQSYTSSVTYSISDDEETDNDGDNSTSNNNDDDDDDDDEANRAYTMSGKSGANVDKSTGRTPTKRGTTRSARTPKPHVERSWVHEDISKVVPRSIQGPVFWQIIPCQRVLFKQFERCIACVSKVLGSCRFARTRVFGIRPESMGKKQTSMSGDDLIYGPFFSSAVDEEPRGTIIPWSRQDMLKRIANRVPNTDATTNNECTRYRFGSPEEFILCRIDAAVRQIIDRELVFAEYDPCYRREPLHLQRQLCDACLTNVLNGFWMCSICGLELCMDCYDEWDTSPDSKRIQQCTYNRRHTRQHMVRMRSYDLAELRWMKETTMQREFPPVPSPSPLVYDASFEFVGHFRPYQKLLVTSDNDQLDKFQACWRRGEACFVPNLLDKFTRSIWTPDWFIAHHGHEVTEMIDCRTGDALTDMTVGRFFQGFSDITVRPNSEDTNCYMILKLKDWPSNDDFRNKFPDHYRDFMRVLPFKPYTHLYGDLNLVNRLSDHYIWPDLGPKMYNAYGSSDGEGGAGTTNLHLDMADAVNIMIYASYLDNLPIEQQEQLLHKKSQPQDDNSNSNSTSRTTTTSSSSPAAANTVKVENRARYPVDDQYEFTERPPGIAAAAVWDIFPLADLPKIRAFLTTIAHERNIPIDDPVHDQTFYLDHSMRERLFREYGVRGWRIFQNPGDAVFVPAGCAHQVCNYASCIKVAMDFVSPENISRCAQLTQEFRRLSKAHRRKQDILQLNTILYSTWQECEALLAQRKKVFSSKNVLAPPPPPPNRSRKRTRNDSTTSTSTTTTTTTTTESPTTAHKRLQIV
ncbi:hypothetical protein BDF22DRAFT_696996 [Syncephalis plumigaleata]|nr:hypothetical protein BDF22DRAFT_696996 [Syncephalis plumigaleata]